MKLRNLFFSIVLAFVTVNAHAQYVTNFYLTDLDNETLKETAQKNISTLLTEFNMAQADGRALNLGGIQISERAQADLNKLWAESPFRCGDTEMIERCLLMHDKSYQVRNIQIFMRGAEDAEEYHEAVIGFNAQGAISDFHLAIDNNLYLKVLKRGTDVTDLRYRQMILDYVEQFRTAYNTKDIAFLEQIFSDDALIITGKVVKSVPSEMNNFMPQDKVVYNKQSKKQYITNLSRVFRNNKHIRVIFDEIKVMKHPAKANYYGVTLKQGYSSDNYSDVGYLFLLWDFNNPDMPQIHVRTWQPDKIGDQPLPEEEIFTCDDFDIV